MRALATPAVFPEEARERENIPAGEGHAQRPDNTTAGSAMLHAPKPAGTGRSAGAAHCATGVVFGSKV